MRFDQLPAGAQAALADWVTPDDVLFALQPDPTLAIVVEKAKSGGRGTTYSATVAFPLGDKWVVSADVQRATAGEVLTAIARRVAQ